MSNALAVWRSLQRINYVFDKKKKKKHKTQMHVPKPDRPRQNDTHVRPPLTHQSHINTTAL